MVLFYLACFLVADVKLNETSLKFYRYDNKGGPSATPEGRYIRTITKVDSGLVDGGRSLKYKSKSLPNIIDFCYVGLFYSIQVCKTVYINLLLAIYVIKVGDDPSSSDSDQYDYFINTRGNLSWVKVNDVEMFQEVYKSEIDAFLEEYGFSVDVIPHNSSCNYAKPPEFH